jgi:putative flippase GtrA
MKLARPVKFLIVGAAGFVVNLAVFALLTELGVPYLAASIASYAISNALMYLGNRYFTFALGHEGFWAAYARYAIVGSVIVALNAAVLAALVELAGLNATLGQALSLIVLTPVAFYLNKRWTFQLADGPDSSGAGA